MVWKAKTSLSELLRRRKQTLQEWMSQMGMTSLDEIHAWCEQHDGVLDIDLPSVMKPVAPRILPKPATEVMVDIVKSIEDSGCPDEPVKVEEKPVEKKKYYSKKEENDPSSGTH